MSKKSVGRSILKAIGVIGGFAAVNICGSIVAARKNAEKMKLHEKEYNLMHSSTMGSEKVTVREDIRNAYFTCFSGGVTVDFPGVPWHDVNLDIFSVLGNVKIMIPEGVNLVCELDGAVMAVNRDEFTDTETEGLPTVRLTGKCFASVVTVEKREITDDGLFNFQIQI